MDVADIIKKRLAQVKDEHQVEILYACESGSRAWGFASVDSDYDVRFIYVHPRDWYLSIDLERRRDVIEVPIQDMMDMVGWDLRKTLRLLRGSNPPLLEWLGSPVVYHDRSPFLEQLRQLALVCHSPLSSARHYLNMARTNFSRYLSGPDISFKKYFYVLRPLLAIRWIETRKSIVPTVFLQLVEGLELEDKLKEAIFFLLEIKKQSAELDRGPRIDAIHEFITRTLEELSLRPISAADHLCDLSTLNAFFRSVLCEIWAER